MPTTQYHVYMNDSPTKGIFDSLEEAKRDALERSPSSNELKIVTVNSPTTVQTWIYDHSIESWVEQL